MIEPQWNEVIQNLSANYFHLHVFLSSFFQEKLISKNVKLFNKSHYIIIKYELISLIKLKLFFVTSPFS
jgi:hypothetical protein